MKFIVLFSLFLLIGCTHKVRVTTKKCKTTGYMSETSADYKTISKTYLFFGLEKEFSLSDLLESSAIDCRKVKYLNYTWKQGPIDSTLSVLPFVNQKTLIVNYAFE